MIETGHRLDFLQKLLPAFRAGEEFGRDHFDGDEILIFAMFGFIYRAQAALAKTISHVIRADGQFCTIAEQQLIDLEDGKPAALNQGFGELPNVAAAAALGHAGQLREDRRQQLMLARIDRLLLEEIIIAVAQVSVALIGVRGSQILNRGEGMP